MEISIFIIVKNVLFWLPAKDLKLKKYKVTVNKTHKVHKYLQSDSQL